MIDLALLPADKVLIAFDNYLRFNKCDVSSKEYAYIRQMISKDNFADDKNIGVVPYFTIQQLVARVWRRMLTVFQAGVEGKLSPQACHDKMEFLLNKLVAELKKATQPKDPNIPQKLYLIKRPPRRSPHR